jgi:isochorismate pyruvate lyase
MKRNSRKWMYLALLWTKSGSASMPSTRAVSLLAQRGKLVTQAANFKKTTDDVRAPARVEQVIDKVRGLAEEAGASAAVVEQVYRAMISAFIAEELNAHAKLTQEASGA